VEELSDVSPLVLVAPTTARYGFGVLSSGGTDMKLKISAALSSVLCATALSVSLAPARAATITDIINFTASGFEPRAPIDPVIGSFTITLDSTVDNLAGTSVVVNSINIPGGGTPFLDTAQASLVDCWEPRKIAFAADR
jgi:hypothetical protein